MQQQFSFTFQDPSGNPIAGGTMTLRLSQDALATFRGTNTGQVMQNRLVSVTLDATGSATILLWPNDQLSPATQYRLKAYTAQGELVYDEWTSFSTSVEYLIQEVNVPSKFLLEAGGGAILLETSI